MNLQIEIIGDLSLAKKLKQSSDKVVQSVQAIISKVALTVESYGKFYSPVDTGLMRSTIYPVNISTKEAWVGPKTFYAKYVHARIPFMTAARESTMPSVDTIIKDQIKKAIN